MFLHSLWLVLGLTAAAVDGGGQYGIGGIVLLAHRDYGPWYGLGLFHLCQDSWIGSLVAVAEIVGQS